MAHKCDSPGCEFSLPDTYPLPKCPWHAVPGRGPVKIAAALTVAAAGFGGGLVYKKFKTYLHEKQLRKERKEHWQRDASGSEQEQKVLGVRKEAAASKSRKRPRKRKTAAAKSKRKPARSEMPNPSGHCGSCVQPAERTAD
jgi:hypothetical protein